ncbi:hypothetical protein ACVWYF_002002 [Hymenobacter sp. UYAg731]
MDSTLTFKNNFLTFQEYAKVSLRFTAKAKPLTLVLLLPLLSVLYFWVQFPWKEASFASFWDSTGFYVCFMTVLLLSIPFSTWRGLKKTYAAARFMQHPVDYQFSEAGMDMNSPLTQIQMVWPAFHSFYDFGRYGVLMSSEASGFFLDFEALLLPAIKSDFLTLLATHQIPVK